MSSDPLVWFHEALSLLDQLPEEVLSLGNAYGGLPVSGSKAEREQAALPHLQTPTTAFTHAGILLVVVGNKLVALHRVLTEPALSLAPWGLARSVLELSSVAAWLLEPDIPAEERARRALNVRIRDIRSNMQYLQSLGPASSSEVGTGQDLRYLEGRLDEIAQKARALELATHNDKSDWLTHIGNAGVPRTTMLAKEIYGQPEAWHLLSAAEHGRSWALLRFGLRRTVQQGAGPGLAYLQESLPIAAVRWLMVSTLAWFIRPAWNRAALAGWPLSQLATLLGEAAHVLDLDPAHHFWADARTSGGTTVVRDLTLGLDPPRTEPAPE